MNSRSWSLSWPAVGPWLLLLRGMAGLCLWDGKKRGANEFLMLDFWSGEERDDRWKKDKVSVAGIDWETHWPGWGGGSLIFFCSVYMRPNFIMKIKKEGSCKVPSTWGQALHQSNVFHSQGLLLSPLLPAPSSSLPWLLSPPSLSL